LPNTSLTTVSIKPSSSPTDNVATWTAPAALNTNAATDSGWDWGPQVTTDGGGNWVAVWRSTDTLGGTIGTDDDILFSCSEFNWNDEHDSDGTPNIDDDDIDGDGMSNDFEGHYGFDLVDDDEMGDAGSEGADGTPDGQNDWDGDGYTNNEEEAASTGPTDPDDYPAGAPVAGSVALLVLTLGVCAVGLRTVRRKEVA